MAGSPDGLFVRRDEASPKSGPLEPRTPRNRCPYFLLSIETTPTTFRRRLSTPLPGSPHSRASSSLWLFHSDPVHKVSGSVGPPGPSVQRWRGYALAKMRISSGTQFDSGMTCHNRSMNRRVVVPKCTSMSSSVAPPDGTHLTHRDCGNRRNSRDVAAARAIPCAITHSSDPGRGPPRPRPRGRSRRSDKDPGLSRSTPRMRVRWGGGGAGGGGGGGGGGGVGGGGVFYE
jgi:hypothetical protein